jgi:glutathione S-transferase
VQNPEAKDTYWATHGAKDSANGRNGGAHFDYLEALLAANGGGSAFFVGAGLTAADLCVWQIVDLHMRLFKEQMEATVSRGGGGAEGHAWGRGRLVGFA